MAEPTLLDHLYSHADRRPDAIYLTQPVGSGQVVDYTWRQVLDEALRMAAHLQGRGLAPGDRVAMLSKNTAHNIIAELAIWIGGFVTVQIFPTEGPDTVRYVLEHSGAKLLFVGKLDQWAHQAPGVPEEVARIALPLATAGHGLDTWASIVAQTPPLTGRPNRPGDELALLIYTSGSTGEPKGVMHGLHAPTFLAERMVANYHLTAEDRLLSYLPLAHVYERAVVEAVSLVCGCRVFFAESTDTFLADLKRARPTVFQSVPRLWLKFQQGVFAKTDRRRLDLLLRIPFVKNIVGRRIREGLGLDSVRLAASASAPIPPELIVWYRRIGLNLLEGYGMTEDFAHSHQSTLERHAPGRVGVPVDGVKTRLTNEGEVQILSPCRLLGYYRRPDLDAEAFTDDGYFRTGDRGDYDDQGLLRITGRTKELFKTAKGKYVAPVPIENLLNEHPLVELSCVAGSGREAAFAMVVLAESIRPKMGEPAVRDEVNRELAALLKRVNARVSGYEHLHTLVVAKEPWTIENGLLTPTLKLKRAKLEAMMAPSLDDWYGRKAPVVWA